jgi:hypothetical protein
LTNVRHGKASYFAGKEWMEISFKFAGSKSNGFWFNPRSGVLHLIGEFETKVPVEFSPWARGRESDFLLILTENRLEL